MTTSAFARNIKNEPGQLIRVGVFPNPPVAFKDDAGKWRGISIDVLQTIADKQGWKLEFLNSIKCGCGQGYYLAKPQSAENITKWLNTKLI